MNKNFRRLMDGAALVGMHRNLFWKTSEGWSWTGARTSRGSSRPRTRRRHCGKPEKAYFDAALEMLGVDAARAAMVGDDIVNDILGAQASGLTGILVRTGKYREGDAGCPHGRPVDVLPPLRTSPRS